MEEKTPEGGQVQTSPNFDDIVEKIGGKFTESTTALEERIIAKFGSIEERIGGVESRFAAPEQKETPSNWDDMDYDQRLEYKNQQLEQKLNQATGELSTRQAAMEAARMAPRVAKSWQYDVPGADAEATEILENMALSNPERFKNLDEQTKTDIIMLAERRAQVKAANVPQDTVQGFQQDSNSDIQKIKDEYAKRGSQIDDEKAKRILERLQAYEEVK